MIVAEPAVTPVTVPAETDAIEELLVDQVPPVVVLAYVVVAPTQTAVVEPVIAAGNALTVTAAVERQAPPIV